MPLPKPPASAESTMAGLAQRRMKSGLRTAAGSVQEQFLARIRALAEDPGVLLPTVVGDEPAPLARLRRALEKAKGGGLPFSARFDKGILGVVRAARELAQQDAAPRLLDARVDGNRRFYLPRGHLLKLVVLGVQNWDDPLALLLAYGPLATKAQLNLFAGRELWCTGRTAAPPAEWFEDLAARTGLHLEVGDDGAACPHADRVRLELRFPGGATLACCGACATKAGHLHGHVLQRALVGASASRPVALAALMPDGRRLEPGEKQGERYRAGVWDEAKLLEKIQSRAADDDEGGDGAGPRFEVAGRRFAELEAFLDGLGLADWERPAVAELVKGGHAGASAAASDVLAAHRDRLAAALDTLLPGEGAPFAAHHTGADVRSVLRLAREEAQRRAATKDLPPLADPGPIGAWLDGLARDRRLLDRPHFLQRIRKEAAHPAFPAHFFAACVAMDLGHEAERFLAHDAKEAGRHLAPLLRPVFAASGPGYVEAVRTYLRESGTGETA